MEYRGTSQTDLLLNFDVVPVPMGLNTPEFIDYKVWLILLCFATATST